MRGRSSYARLTLANYDPDLQLATDPLVDWAKAACRAALPELSGGAQPFARVRGLACATVAWKLRLAWGFPSAYAFTDRSGALLDLRSTCLATVAAHAARDLVSQAISRHATG